MTVSIVSPSAAAGKAPPSSPFQTRRHPRAGNFTRAESLRATHCPEFSPGTWCAHPRHEKYGFRAGAPHTRTETRF